VTPCTNGAVTSGVDAVVNVPEPPLPTFPETSRAPPTDTYMNVPPGSGFVGTNVAWSCVPFRLSVPDTPAPPPHTPTLTPPPPPHPAPPTEPGPPASLHATPPLAPTGTFPPDGVTPCTLGPVVSTTTDDRVVNVVVFPTTTFPDRSVNPPTVTVYVVDGESRPDGTNTSVCSSDPTLSVPATLPLPVTVTDPGPTLSAATASLTPTRTCAPTATSLDPSAALTPTTLGDTVSVPPPVVKLAK